MAPDDRSAHAAAIADAARPYLHADGLHNVVALHDDASTWAQPSVYQERSSALAEATRLADTKQVLTYVVGRHAGLLTVWAGCEQLATFAAETEAIHLWFSLTYANYLIVPRSVLQSMPDEWQARFVGLLREMEEAFGHLDWPSYDVRALAREREHIHVSEDCERCDGEGRTDADVESDVGCPRCKGSGVDPDGAEDIRYETAEEVGIRDDPIPHYNRGRTRLEPRGIKVHNHSYEPGSEATHDGGQPHGA